MKRKKGNRIDPREQTPPGYFLRQSQWTPEEKGTTTFFSMRDTLVFAFLVAACLIVGAVLWIKPPQFISFDNTPKKPYDPGVAAKNMPKQLRLFPGYDPRIFEEITDDDPAIRGDEEDLPYREPAEPPKPRTLKSRLLKTIQTLFASLRFRLLV